jgi:hypothetical protein
LGAAKLLIIIFVHLSLRFAKQKVALLAWPFIGHIIGHYRWKFVRGVAYVVV